MTTQSLARRVRAERGYAMAALLVSIAIMGILASVAMPVWKQAAQREKEAELIFRAGQYAHAIEKFKRKYANQYPPDVDILINQRFLRKKYKDPMTKDGEWRIVTPQELQGVAISNVPGSTRPGTTGVTTPSGSTFRPAGPGAAAPPLSQPTGSSLNQPTGSSFQPGAGQSSFGINSPGGRTVNVGPIAAVASKSTQHSIRIFKGRDRYDQWLVTVEDVMPRQFRPQQPNQPNQPGRSNQPGSSRPGSSSPGFGQPGSSTPPRR